MARSVALAASLLASVSLSISCSSVGPAVLASSAELTPIRHVVLDPTPDEFFSGLVVGQSLLLPDLNGGHVLEYDLATGERSAERGATGSRPGELMRPYLVFATQDGFGVADVGGLQQLKYFDRVWRFLREKPTVKMDSGTGYNFLAPPLWLDGRLVGGGVGSPEVFGGRDGVFVFALKADGSLTPLLWREGPQASSEELAFNDIAGGVASVSERNWVFLDGLTNRYFLFNRRDAKVREFHGDATLWSAPDFGAAPTGYDRGAHFVWRLDQAAVLQPVSLGGARIATVARTRPAGNVVSYFLEVYDAAKGQFLGRRQLRLPPEKERLVLVARGEPGRLVVVTRASWQPGSQADVFEFDLDAGARRGPAAGR